VSQKNAPNSACCSFHKDGLILIVSWWTASAHFQKWYAYSTFLVSSFYILYLLLNTYDVNDAFWRHSMLVKPSSSFSSKHRILSPDPCPPNSAVDPETRSTTQFDDWCRNVCILYKTYVRDTSDLMQRINDTGKPVTKRRSCWSMEKAVMCLHEGKRTSLWTSAKPTLFRATNSLPRETHCSRPVHRSYLKANNIYGEIKLCNNISKSGGIKKVEYACHF